MTREIDQLTFRVDLNTPVSVIDRANRQNIREDTNNLNNTSSDQGPRVCGMLFLITTRVLTVILLFAHGIKEQCPTLRV